MDSHGFTLENRRLLQFSACLERPEKDRFSSAGGNKWGNKSGVFANRIALMPLRIHFSHSAKMTVPNSAADSPETPPFLEPKQSPSRASSTRRFGWLLHPVRLQEQGNPWQFIFRVIAQLFLLKVTTALLVGWFVPDNDHDPNDDMLRVAWFWPLVALFFAPIVETLLFQVSPIEISRLFRAPRLLQYLLGAIPFGAMHFSQGVASGTSAILAGLLLSHAYLEGRNRSWWTAFWVTAMVHFAQNLVVLPFALWMAKS